MFLSIERIGSYRFVLGALIFVVLLTGCGGADNTINTDTDLTNNLVVTGEVPGTLIEAYGTNGSYHATESTGNMVGGFKRFSLALPPQVIYSLFMTVSESSATQKITTPVLFRDPSGQLTPFFTGADDNAHNIIDLGQLRIYKTRTEAGGNHLNGVVIESSRPVLSVFSARAIDAGIQTTSDGVKLWDHDNDSVHNVYDTDYLPVNDTDKDGIPDHIDINPNNNRTGSSAPATFVDSNGDGYLDGDANRDGFLDSDHDFDGYDDNLGVGNLSNDWQLVWADEFNGSVIDTSKWSKESNCWGGGNNELQCYTDRTTNAFLDDGKLVIRAQKESFTGPAEPTDWNSNAGNRTLPYTSARLRTLNKGDWTYGRMEVRAKLPAGQGIWPAIWMLPSDSVYGQWASSGEIDIMEAINLNATAANQQIHGTIHYGGQWPENRHSGETYTFVSDNPTQTFHTYTIEWGAGIIRWYVDDLLYATRRSSTWYTTGASTDSAPFDKRFHLLLNVAVGGNWPGAPNASTLLPVKMEVDYVRVYACPTISSTLLVCPM